MTALYLVSLGMVWQMRLFSTKKMFLTAGRKSGFRESELLSTFWLHRQLCDPTIFFPLFVLCRGRHQLFPSGSLRVWRGVSIWLINRDFLLSSLISTTIWKPILWGLEKKWDCWLLIVEVVRAALSCFSLIHINSLWSLSTSKWGAGFKAFENN